MVSEFGEFGFLGLREELGFYLAVEALAVGCQLVQPHHLHPELRELPLQLPVRLLHLPQVHVDLLPVGPHDLHGLPGLLEIEVELGDRGLQLGDLVGEQGGGGSGLGEGGLLELDLGCEMEGALLVVALFGF